uniref:Palmitoyltransferase n=1 Tax=Clastoptera arizonana TaxID=38151 RepID=A0A1B6D9K9_9HEMI
MANSSEIGSSGPCGWCVRAVKWVPVLFILTIVGWSYYAYVIQLCFIIVESPFEKILYLIGYHITFVTFIWSYWQTVFTAVGTVPRKFKLSKEDIEKLRQVESEEAHRSILEHHGQSLPVCNRTINGLLRYCEKCKHIKPDRAHHCSVCGVCVLKMDHHCPWVNNCVNFYNYKYFILFLGYALIYCLYIVFTSMPYFIQFWQGDLEGMGRFHILFLFFVAAMFAVSLVSLFCYHCYLVIHNRSTLEAFRAPIFPSGPDKDGFSLGKYNNFQEVFGDKRWCWFLPVFSSLGDGVTFPQRVIDEDTDHLLGGRQHWSDDDSPTHQARNEFNHGTGQQSNLMQVV